MSQPALASSAPAPFLRRGFDWWLAQVKHALPPTIFFFIGFNLILWTKRLILEEHGVEFSGFLTATLAALLVGKAVLVTDNLPFMHRFDGAPMIPDSWREWRETVEYGLSIALAFLTGNILMTLIFFILPSTIASSGKPNAAAYRIARMLGQHVGRETMRRRARRIQDLMQTVGPIVGVLATAAGSVYTGLKGVFGQ